MSTDENQNFLNEFRQIKDDIMDVLNRDIGKRVEQIEKTLYLGNGKPSILSRVSEMEAYIKQFDKKLDNLLENTKHIPGMKVELDSVEDWQKNKDDVSRGLRIEKWGGIYQAVGAVITMILGTIIGLYVASPSDALIEEAVQRAISRAQPVKVIDSDRYALPKNANITK